MTNKSEAQRTGGVWVVGYSSPEDKNKSCLAIWEKTVLDSGFGSPICKISPEETMDDRDKANAAFIVTACNAHDSLVEALREIRKEVDLPEHIAAIVTKALNNIK